MVKFQVDVGARKPIYRQIADQIREAIARGRLAPGDQLPTVRQLAKDLVINPNTVARVYGELERDRILITCAGAGTFVAELHSELSHQARAKRLVELIDAILTDAVHFGLSEAEILALFRERVQQFEWRESSRTREEEQVP